MCPPHARMEGRVRIIGVKLGSRAHAQQDMMESSVRRVNDFCIDYILNKS